MKHLLLTTIAAALLVGCGEPSLYEAIAKGNARAVKQHLAAGTDLNARSRASRPPLHEAASWGHKKSPLIAELLIAKGADVNAKTKNEWTPLDWAIRTDEYETADFLRKHGGKTAATSPADLERQERRREPVKQTSRSTSNKRGESIKKSMQEWLNRTYSGQLIIPPRVLEVSVVSTGPFSNTHKGIAKVQHKGKVHNVVVTITADGESAMWEARPGSFLFLAQ